MLSAVQIGRHSIDFPVGLAPMAGVTDRPFRALCRRLGAGYVVGEMVSANPDTFATAKSRWRRAHDGEPTPVVVQIAGSDPTQLASCAAREVDQGADIIDINMGCPAKKVCNQAAGSALLADPQRVDKILRAVVDAIAPLPVTLKIRTGLDPASRNALLIGRIAEQAGIRLLAIHGRTRNEHFTGVAEHATTTAVKAALAIPVFANGDLDCPRTVRAVLEQTGADGVLIGRAAQGNPFIFAELRAALSGQPLPMVTVAERLQVLSAHVQAVHEFYGADHGVRIARKHIDWSLAWLGVAKAERRSCLTAIDAATQLALLDQALSDRLQTCAA